MERRALGDQGRVKGFLDRLLLELKRCEGVVGVLMSSGEDVLAATGIFERLARYLDPESWAVTVSALACLLRNAVVSQGVEVDGFLEWERKLGPIIVNLPKHTLLVIPLLFEYDQVYEDLRALVLTVACDRRYPRGFVEMQVSRALDRVADERGASA